MLHRIVHRASWCAPLLAVALALPLSAAPQPAVPPGTAVPLQFDQDISTKFAQKGDKVKLRVYTDVAVDEKIVIKQDAPAIGVVESVKKPGIFGRRGELRIRLESVTDTHGKRVPLEPYTSGNRFDAVGPGAASAGLLVLGPIGVVGGAFIKGSHVTIDKGTRIVAVVWDGQTKPEERRAKEERAREEHPKVELP